jgi:peptidoglycan/xylan/chitin deacetylase (PgdA/CDA1 family)
MNRDFLGYDESYPAVQWPHDAQLAVSFVLNIEEGAELSLSSGDAENEASHEVRQQVEGAPDLCMESHFEFGPRIGYRRITRLADAHGIPLTLNACARALETTPWIARDAALKGYEVCCHGYRWEPHAGMAEAAERELIRRAASAIARLTGRAPVGWHTKSSASVNTRRLLVEHGGFLYDSDAYNDETPFYVDVAGRSHLVLPYAFDTNDMRFFEPYAFTRAADFADYVIDAFEWLWREGAHAPKMLSVGLHTRIIGRAARIRGLEAVFDHMRAKGRVWFAKREDIARFWLEHVPAPA